MFDMLRELTELDGVSGDEKSVRDYIISKIDGFCEYKTDPLGNIIAFKKGRNRSVKKLLVDAHTDEVGLIITSVTADGFLKFSAVGGIDTSVLMFRRVRIGKINGVISGKPVHLLSGDEKKKLPKADSLYIFRCQLHFRPPLSAFCRTLADIVFSAERARMHRKASRPLQI